MVKSHCPYPWTTQSQLRLENTVTAQVKAKGERARRTVRVCTNITTLPYAHRGEKEEMERRNWKKESEKRKRKERGQPQASMQAQLSHSVPPPPYLGVPKATEIWIKVKQDSLGRPGQGDSPNQQNDQHEVWERGREIHHLGEGRRDKHERAARARAHSPGWQHSTDPRAGGDGQRQGTGQAASPSTLLSPAVERNAF